MRWAFALLLVAGCRQILGIDDPRPLATDAPLEVDGAVDAPCSDVDSDGICDAVDDWPCGVKPVVPSVVDETTNNGLTTLQITAFSFASATPFAVVAPSSLADREV